MSRLIATLTWFVQEGQYMTGHISTHCHDKSQSILFSRVLKYVFIYIFYVSLTSEIGCENELLYVFIIMTHFIISLMQVMQ